MKLTLIFFVFTFCMFCQTGNETNIPENLRPPADQKLLLQAHGVGDQIYGCKKAGDTYDWVLKAPDAQLFSADDQVVGHHFAGPTWEWKDKSAVVGKMAVSKPSPNSDSVPWLLVNVIRHEGEGVMTNVATVQRLNTKGGKARTDGCDASNVGKEQRVHYQADYLFYGK